MTVNNERSSRNSNRREFECSGRIRNRPAESKFDARPVHTRPRRVFRGCFQAVDARSSRVEPDNEPTKRITRLVSSFHSESPDSPVRVYHVVPSFVRCAPVREIEQTGNTHFIDSRLLARRIRRMTNGLCSRFDDRNLLVPF